MLRWHYVLKEVHKGGCGHHIGGKSLALKVLRAKYYWPSMIWDAREFIKCYPSCQQHTHFGVAHPEDLNTISSSWPFHRWGLDLLGPFSLALGQLKYLIKVVDYFTKWIEAEPLLLIMAAQYRKFVWQNIITHFGIPSSIVTDNGTQFANRKFQEMLFGLKIKQNFTLWNIRKSKGKLNPQIR